ncbi:6085_t:CDS:2 [Funneliformis geosporum]|uniref:4717_t:CDS:1 n=1 Tax=Funneliformis geosporum TaxID=1117311 RepID=A0A9W4WT08_9GLOM|nr:6085_t:CDS:2 [Funneliformis geosporum]CAI2176523.1 4717_t:CDS:2 [Funneliformis geosporum]
MKQTQQQTKLSESSEKASIEETKNENEDISDDNEDIADKLLARIEAKRVEEEKNAALKISEPSNKIPKSKKPNRQKLRKARKAAEMAELQREAENEAKNQPNMKEVEREKIIDIVTMMGLSIKETDYKELRRKTAAYMRENPDDFIPFLPTKDDGKCSPEQFSKYCDELENTAVWGGQLEIIAISKAFKLPVHVIQMNSPLMKISDDEFLNKEPIVISYHRHMYGLGAHYNSLRKI